jgi:uncharacterized repeat protein (TIGR03803 family)
MKILRIPMVIVLLVVAGRVTAQTFTNLHTFAAADINGNNSDGVGPGAPILSGNILYGTASGGGTNGNGTFFSVKTNGTDFTALYTFMATNANGNNSDGIGPSISVLSGNTLYGAAFDGGTNGNGTIFAVKTNGTGFTTLHDFTSVSVGFPSTNSDGIGPNPLSLSGTILYGTTQVGGRSGAGTLFSINTNGLSFASLFSFPEDYDNALPEGPLILSGNILYGTFDLGGDSGNGNPFAININGLGFTNLYSFTATDANGNNRDGANPVEGLVLSGSTLYGPASAGGTNGNGTVFSLTLGAVSQPPFPTNQITKIQLSGTNVVLTIPSVAGETYQLQFSSSLNPTNWSNVPGASVTNSIGGVLTLTNFGGALAPQRFYRLDITP